MTDSEQTILADGVSHVDYIKQVDLMAADRMRKIGLESILVYVIDTVPVEVLDYLAVQFDVVGAKGMIMATTEEEKRAVIKSAIELHKYKGTGWSVKQALLKYGFSNVVITENVEGHWANFSLKLYLGSKGLNGSALNSVLDIVETYKSYRSKLVGLIIGIDISETVTVTDKFNFFDQKQFADDVGIGGVVKHDGQVIRNGTRNYNKENDVLIINKVYA